MDTFAILHLYLGIISLCMCIKYDTLTYFHFSCMNMLLFISQVNNELDMLFVLDVGYVIHMFICFLYFVDSVP